MSISIVDLTLFFPFITADTHPEKINNKPISRSFNHMVTEELNWIHQRIHLQ